MKEGRAPANSSAKQPRQRFGTAAVQYREKTRLPRQAATNQLQLWAQSQWCENPPHSTQAPRRPSLRLLAISYSKARTIAWREPDVREVDPYSSHGPRPFRNRNDRSSPCSKRNDSTRSATKLWPTPPSPYEGRP